LEPISFPLSHRGWQGLFHRKKDELKLFLEEFNKQVEVFNKKIETFSETLNKIWSKDDEVVLVAGKRAE
jgi:hypothetical protein